MNKLLIFDLDGTLIDTLDDLKNAVNFALEKFSFPLRTREEIRKAIGNGTIKLIERSAPQGTDEKTLSELHKVFKAFYLENLSQNTKPYPGVTSLLFSLKTKGYKLAVVSNKDHDATIKLITTMFPMLFDYIQGSYFEHPKKPHPYLINKVINEINFSKDKITYIGDTNVDEESAINADISYILVSYGYRTKTELFSQVKTRNIVDSIKDLDSTL